MGMAMMSAVPSQLAWRWRRVPRLRRWFLEDGDKLVRVKSWRPYLGPHGLEWPCLLIDSNRHRRMSINPVWDRSRLLSPFRDLVEKR